MTLNTIIEEEKKEFTEKFSYGGFGGLIPQHRDGGRILMEEVQTFLTTAMQRAWKDSRIDWLRSEIERSEKKMNDEEAKQTESTWEDGWKQGYIRAHEYNITRHKEELKELTGE